MQAKGNATSGPSPLHYPDFRQYSLGESGGKTIDLGANPVGIYQNRRTVILEQVGGEASPNEAPVGHHTSAFSNATMAVIKQKNISETLPGTKDSKSSLTFHMLQ
ncbi:hypothetical protein ACJJIW_12075 [Microbulbifer sp. JMSA004]|uniref:hypothetical protein n=1 Tax=unclassified Microbulbifer TaxID=2619833 RepID=UPI0024ADA8F7|nr:hypothetical protein [Microbulbifer sp. VAAF005]WHI46040.1 hypothetical protein P0078_20315 [Microbulbifer sp. VAAF005]